LNGSWTSNLKTSIARSNVLRLGKVWPACGQGGGTVVTAIEVSTKDVGYKRVLTGLIRSSGLCTCPQLFFCPPAWNEWRLFAVRT